MSIASTLTKISRAIVKQAVGIHTANLMGNISEAYKKQDAAENHEQDMIELSRRVNEQKRAATLAADEAARHATAVHQAVYAEIESLPSYR